MTPYENLARAIVTQAIADYIPYYTALEKYRAMDTSLSIPDESLALWSGLGNRYTR